MGARNRARHVEAARHLLPDVDVVGYAAGRARSDPVFVMVVLAFGYGLTAVAIYAFTEALPLVLLALPVFVYLVHFFSPPRAIAVTNQGVAVLARGVVPDLPNKVLAREHRRAAQPERMSGGRVRIRVGDHAIWLSRGEEAQLRSAMGVATSERPAHLPSGPLPDLHANDDPITGPLPGPPPPGT